MDKAKYMEAMKLLRNPDTHAEGLVMLDGLVNTDSEAYTANMELMKQKDASISTLRDSQARLALKLTEDITGQMTTPPEETREQEFDRLFRSKFKPEEEKK